MFRVGLITCASENPIERSTSEPAISTPAKTAATPKASALPMSICSSSWGPNVTTSSATPRRSTEGIANIEVATAIPTRRRIGTVFDANTGARVKRPPTRASTRKNVAIWSPVNVSTGGIGR